MLHLEIIFGLLLAPPIRDRAGWQWHSLGWAGTLALTAAVIGADLAACVQWQRLRVRPQGVRKLQQRALMALGVYFFAGGWITYHHFRRSPELAMEPYGFLNAARIRKGLAPTPDGLSRDPMEGEREKQRLRGRRINGNIKP
jgi:hypothetical protein